MNQRQEVTTAEGGEVRKPEVQPEAVLYPPVDIYEDAEGIHLQADMPGVSKDRLTVQVDRDTLLIEGEAKIEMPEGMNALYADVRSTRYRRSFTLSSELKSEVIEANLKDGVLSVRIPKREEAKPRKIEVRTQ
ncbi:MAG: Spore protein SP21 [Gammaproteobacteria bacterium]|nr:Spore protein SP21 [Gammaproteobacteria bacterium]